MAFGVTGIVTYVETVRSNRKRERETAEAGEVYAERQQLIRKTANEIAPEIN